MVSIIRVTGGAIRFTSLKAVVFKELSLKVRKIFDIRQKMSPRRRASSGGRITIPSVIPTTSPPPLQQQHNHTSPTPHAMTSGSSSSTSPSLPICRYYAQGFCSRGDRCNFSHDDQSQQVDSNRANRKEQTEVKKEGENIIARATG